MDRNKPLCPGLSAAERMVVYVLFFLVPFQDLHHFVKFRGRQGGIHQTKQRLPDQPDAHDNDLHRNHHSDDWIERLALRFEERFGEVQINDPFKGGFIVRSQGGSFPWIQIELSRDPSLSTLEKQERVLGALESWEIDVQSSRV